MILHRTALPAALVGCALALTACGGRSTTTTASTTGATPTAGPSATVGRGAGGHAPSLTSATPNPTGSAAALATSAASSSGSTVSGTAPGRTTAGKETPAGTTVPGTYTYDGKGTYSVGGGTPQDASGTSTLTVDAVAKGAQHSLQKASIGNTDQTVVRRAGATYLTDLTLTSKAYTKEFRSPAGLLLLPGQLTVGKTWSWTATSTDGKTTAKQTSKVTKTETVLVGGRSVPTTVVETTLTLSGDLDATDQMTTDQDVAAQLPVKTRSVLSGTYSGFAFKGDLTATLRSLSTS